MSQYFFTTSRKEQAVQGFQPNRSYTKDETDQNFIKSPNIRTFTASTTPPPNPQLYDLWLEVPA